jgi:hypothetical protein
MTTKQRLSAYRFMLKQFNIGDKWTPSCFCSAIRHAHFHKHESFSISIEDYPELMGHKPPRESMYNNGYWFRPHKYGIRIDVLIECIEECKLKIKEDDSNN